MKIHCKIKIISGRNNNKMYNYNKILKEFPEILETNLERANFKKAEYLDKIITIFKQFISKCEKQIDHIITQKINKLNNNFKKVQQYIHQEEGLPNEQTNLIIAQFLIKPFQKFPFTGHKNQKLFKEQYNLIEKASVLIEQTLTQSFKEDEVPTFQNNKFFQTIKAHGIGHQSLTKLRLNPQNFEICPLHEIIPYQCKVNSIIKLNNQCVLCFGDEKFIEVWDVMENYCIKKIQISIPAQISTALLAYSNGCSYLFIGFSDQNPIIASYRLDFWKCFATNVTHRQKITKLIQYQQKYLISGSADGLICLNDFFTMKSLVSSSHISGIQDIFIKNNYIYILQKNSTVLEYEFCKTNISLNFRRSISAGYISMIRSPELTTNFSGIGCHIYGISQIQITRKFKMEEINIINVPEMISDFILLQSKQTSEYFALCVFQNSSTLRIYSLTTQEQVYQYSLEYTGQVGASGYLPKIQISWIDNKYVLIVVNKSEFEDDPNIIKCYELKI